MIIHLISGPRNVSTALMYSFAQRPDTQVLDEPFYGFYLHYTGADHPGRREVMEHMECDPEKVFRQIEVHAKQKPVVFVKNMGHHLQGFDYTPILHYHNVLLIRDPGQMLVSYAKVREFPTIDDIGLRFQANLFQWLQETGKEPLVLDGTELRKNPAAVLGMLCQKLGLSFTGNMLHWPAGPIAEDGIWAKYWYSNVHQSTSFVAPEDEHTVIPEVLLPIYEEAMTYYQLLSKYAIKT